jgi:hypothetical protein
MVVNIGAVHRERIGTGYNDLLLGQINCSFNRRPDAKKPVGCSENNAIDEMQDQQPDQRRDRDFRVPKKPAPANGMNATIIISQANTPTMMPFSQWAGWVATPS